jgi:hypothetical protein
MLGSLRYNDELSKSARVEVGTTAESRTRSLRAVVVSPCPGNAARRDASSSSKTIL